MGTKTINSKHRIFLILAYLIGLVLFVAAPALAGVQQKAVLNTAAADYSSGAHAVIDVDPIGGPRQSNDNLNPTISDLTVVSHGRYFYVIERFNADNITKYDIAEPATPIWQYSTMDQADSVSTSNPQDLVFARPNKAYLLRHNTKTAWIVNPQASSKQNFKIGTLDLSAYSDGDDYGPEMTQGIVVNGKLFILMPRFNQDENFEPQEAYLAVFDTATDQEINTWQGENGLKGIHLPIKNTSAINYLPENDTIYVQGNGRLESSWSGTPAEYTGGIVAVDPDTYQTQMVVDDGDQQNHPYGNISGMITVNATKGYFVGYHSFGNNTLYSFNPTTGDVHGSPVDMLKNISIPGMEAGGQVDKNGLVWITDATNSRIVILDPSDDSVDETLPTELNPQKVVFVTYDDDNIDITANGAQGPLSISAKEKVFLDLNYQPGQKAGQKADWWIGALVNQSQWYTLQLDPFGWQKTIDVTAQIDKINISELNIYNNYLPVGSYTFLFAVDDNADGKFDGTCFDFVEVDVSE